MSLPTDAKTRKSIPVFTGFMKYFPRAIAEVAVLSKAGNDQHNPGKPLHWDRSKSGDELEALSRHLLEAGTVDTDGMRHSAKVAWRAMANLEKELEAAEAAEEAKLEEEKAKAKAQRFNDYLDAYSRVMRTQIDNMATQTLIGVNPWDYKPGKVVLTDKDPSKYRWPAIKYEGNPFSIVPGPCDYT